MNLNSYWWRDDHDLWFDSAYHFWPILCA